jgi:maltose-binding protein MalE
MRKFVLPLILVASLGVSSMAMAATASATTTEGTIKALDAKAMTLTLNDGSVYGLAKTIKVASLKVGEKVKVTWSKIGKIDEASAVVAE